MNIIDYAIKHSIRQGNALALVDAEDETRALTWEESVSAIKRFASAIQRLGVKTGECVALLSRNDIFYAVAMMGTALAGAVFIGLPQQSSESELDRFLEICGAKWLFVEPDLLHIAENAISTLKTDPPYLWLFDGGQPGRLIRDKLTFTALLQEGREDIGLDADLRDQPCTLVLTSGTTGWPKAAVLAHSTMMARKPPPPKATSEYHRSLHPTPLYHATGASVVLDALLGIHTLYVSRETDPYSIIDNISKYSITKMISHPRLAEEVSSVILDGKRPKESLHTLRLSILGGSILSRKTFKTLVSVLTPEARVVNAYGCTETGLAFTHEAGRPADPTYVGIAAPGVEVRLIHPETLDDVEPGSEGELLVRSSQVFAGYFRNPDATAVTFLEDARGGTPFVRTGDKAVFCVEKRQYRITGRYKEVFKVGDGKEVSPDEVQETLKSLVSIEDAAVTSRPGRRGNGDLEPSAYVVTKDKQLSAQAIVDFVAKSLSSYKAPTGGVVFVDKIPRTAFGKIIKRELLSKGNGDFITPAV